MEKEQPRDEKNIGKDENEKNNFLFDNRTGICTVVYYRVHFVSQSGLLGRKQNARQASAGSRVTVEVRKAEIRSILPTSTYDATLLAGEEGVVGADIPGKVVQILFKEGEAVKKGAPLIVLDSQA